MCQMELILCLAYRHIYGREVKLKLSHKTGHPETIMRDNWNKLVRQKRLGLDYWVLEPRKMIQKQRTIEDPMKSSKKGFRP